MSPNDRVRPIDREDVCGKGRVYLRHRESFSSYAILMLDPDGVVIYRNEEAARLLGWQASELVVGRPVAERLPEPERADIEEIIRAVIGGAVWEGEFEHYRTDGSRVWIGGHMSRITDSSGKVLGLLGLGQDITERKRLEEQSCQSRKMEAVGQLTGGLAHEFNNLLTVINGYGDLLLSDLRPEDPHRQMVAEMRKAGERAADLTRQLLAFGCKQILRPKVLDLNRVVSEMGKPLRCTVGEDIELILDLQPGLPPVHADQGHIEQVILNLAVNARDAMPQGGRLVIQTGNVQFDEGYARSHPEVTAGPYVLLEMRDSGCGMSREVMSRIFEPFFTTKEVGKGTGLGLAVVHGIVRQSGGHIEVDSQPRRGTSVRIYLPRAESGH